MLTGPSEEESPLHIPSSSVENKEEQQEPKSRQKKFVQFDDSKIIYSRFGPLIWRSSKDRKKLNKAARNAKCNSGDSGIQIEVGITSSFLLASFYYIKHIVT